MKTGLTKSIVSPQNFESQKDKEKGFENCFPKPNLVGVTRLERAIPASQTLTSRFFA